MFSISIYIHHTQWSELSRFENLVGGKLCLWRRLCLRQRVAPIWVIEVIAMKWLSPEDVQTLTGRKQLGKQVEALRSMKINHTVRPDGTPVVFVNDLSCDKTTAVTGTSTFVINKEPNYG